MLNDVVERSGVIKKISVVTSDDALTELLTLLLQSWKFEIVSQDCAETLLLAEKGSIEPAAGQDVIWLAAGETSTDNSLGLPLEVESLWRILEFRFHDPPRMHIRLALDLSAQVTIRGETSEAVLTSLSEMGCRFYYDKELVRDETVTLTLQAGNETLKIGSQVIYSIPQSATSTGEVNAGLVFHGIDRTTRGRIRTYLIYTYLKEVGSVMAEERFVDTLDFLVLPESIRKKLAG